MPGGPGQPPPGKAKIGLLIAIVVVAVLLLITLAGTAIWALTGSTDDEASTTATSTASVSPSEEATAAEPSPVATTTPEPTETDDAAADLAFVYPDTFRGMALDLAESQQEARRSEYRSTGYYGDFPTELHFQWFPDTSIAAGDYDIVQFDDGMRAPEDEGDGLCWENENGVYFKWTCVLDIAGGAMMLTGTEGLDDAKGLMAALEEMASLLR